MSNARIALDRLPPTARPRPQLRSVAQPPEPAAEAADEMGARPAVLVVSPFGAVGEAVGSALAEVAEVHLRCADGDPAFRKIDDAVLTDVDAVLYDIAGLLHGGLDLDRLIAQSGLRVIGLTVADRPDLASRAVQRGVVSLVSATWSGQHLAQQVLRQATGPAVSSRR